MRFLLSKAFLFFTLFFYCASAWAQLTLRLTSIPALPVQPDIFIAGNFNGWNPGLSQYKLQKDNQNQYYITLQPPAGTLEFKFTMGSWASVETTASGADIANRRYNYNGQAAEITLSIAGWKGVVSSTASANVILMDDDFPMKSLNRTRRIWLYLPPDYHTNPTRRYNVIYMLDGQNLFDAALSFSGEWKVDESLDQLFAQKGKSCIVVAIANGGTQRLNEYSPWVNAQYGGGQGSKFLEFITEELKPFIDQHYRTRAEPAHTAIAGSSMGGLFSFYAAFARPDVFSRSGALSSSFWFSPQVFTMIEDLQTLPPLQKIYLCAGAAEGGSQVADMKKMEMLLKDRGMSADQLYAVANAGQGHNESYWASVFPSVLEWLFPDNTSAEEEIVFDREVYSINCTDSICTYTGPVCKECLLYFTDAAGRHIYTHSLDDGYQWEIQNSRESIMIYRLSHKGQVLASGKILYKK